MSVWKKKFATVYLTGKQKLEVGSIIKTVDFARRERQYQIKHWYSDAQKNIWGEWERRCRVDVVGEMRRMDICLIYTPKEVQDDS